MSQLENMMRELREPVPMYGAARVTLSSYLLMLAGVVTILSIAIIVTGKLA